MDYALIIDSSGNGISSHFYPTTPKSYPANEIPCTQAQAQNPTMWMRGSAGAIEASLPAARDRQKAILEVAYAAASSADVSFTTAAGVAKTYQADGSSQHVLLRAWTGYDAAGAVPSGFYWVAADNTQVPFTLADLKGLYATMLAQGWAAFQHLQQRKAQVLAASDVASVQAVVW